jgi:hypothetical protein
VVGVGVAQVPEPEQNAAGVKAAVVVLQAAAPQETVLAAWVQAPAPLQAPVLPQVPLAAQRVCGSAVPLPTLAQVPAVAARLQAWQVGQLVLPQQTPSTQLPLVHSWPAPQVAPEPFLAAQLPAVAAVQKSPATQSVSAAQLVLQAVAEAQT